MPAVLATTLAQGTITIITITITIIIITAIITVAIPAATGIGDITNHTSTGNMVFAITIPEDAGRY